MLLAGAGVIALCLYCARGVTKQGEPAASHSYNRSPPQAGGLPDIEDTPGAGRPAGIRTYRIPHTTEINEIVEGVSTIHTIAWTTTEFNTQELASTGSFWGAKAHLGPWQGSGYARFLRSPDYPRKEKHWEGL